MTKQIQVLDHGYVRYIEHWGNDNTPLEAARMSTGNATGVDEGKDDRLRRRLWKDKHVTPFEMLGLHIEAQAPIFGARQIFRHRSFSMNEHSGRYADMPALYYLPAADAITGQDPHNKQMAGAPLSPEAQRRAQVVIAEATRRAREAYEELQALGVAREMARIVLPLNQYTRWRMQGNLRQWAHFLSLRLAPDVQPETRAYAEAIAAIVAEHFPKTWAVMSEDFAR